MRLFFYSPTNLHKKYYTTNILSFNITSAEGIALSPAYLNAPALAVTTNGTNVTVSWGPVAGATGYTLFYSPYPLDNPISSVDMGPQTGLSVTLPEGAAYYVRVKAYNDTGSSEYSDVVVIGQ